MRIIGGGSIESGPKARWGHGLCHMRTLKVNQWAKLVPLNAQLDSPRLFISEECTNMIYAMTEYSGVSREESCKDFVDVLRYAAVTPLEYVGNQQLVASGGGGY